MKVEDTKGKTLIVAMSSDKGLCGGVHSTISRAIRRDLATAGNQAIEIVSIGDKCKMQLARIAPERMVLSFSSVGQRPPTFLDASLISQKLMTLGDYSQVLLYFNKYVLFQTFFFAFFATLQA